MSPPSPENLGRAPAWENYVIAQTVAASRGQIPENALAFGVEVDGARLWLRFQLSEVTEQDRADMDDIVSELEGLVGQDVEVGSSFEVLKAREILPTDHVCWVFLARGAGDCVREEISVGLSRDEALVLFEWLTRTGDSEQPPVFEDQAEQRVLRDLESALENHLTEPLRSDYRGLLEAARARVRDQE